YSLHAQMGRTTKILLLLCFAGFLLVSQARADCGGCQPPSADPANVQQQIQQSAQRSDTVATANNAADCCCCTIDCSCPCCVPSSPQGPAGLQIVWLRVPAPTKVVAVVRLAQRASESTFAAPRRGWQPLPGCSAPKDNLLRGTKLLPLLS
ncbi:MAG: hypothetical protein QGG14_05410, partial [Planctomycetota bacterium]|nr:hypothetical protein [Planctomycetota bacterium]